MSADLTIKGKKKPAKKKPVTPQHACAEGFMDEMKPDAEKRDFSAADRRRLAAEHKALPDGSYPIENSEDLHNAAILARSGHGDVEGARALIARRAKELGVSNPLDAVKRMTGADEMAAYGNPAAVRDYNADRVSEPLTAGHAAPSTGDHGVGAGRNPEIAAHHPSLRQGGSTTFPLLNNVQLAHGNTFFGQVGFSEPARVNVTRLDTGGHDTQFTSQPGGNPASRAGDHQHRDSATPPNGTHTPGNPCRPPTQAMKSGDALDIMKKALFG